MYVYESGRARAMFNCKEKKKYFKQNLISFFSLLIFAFSFYFHFNLDTDGTTKAPIPKPLIKTSPKKLQQEQLQQQQLQMQPNEFDTNAIKEQPIEDVSVQKQGRGNCYTEPMHHNCVTSELYLIT